MSADRRRPKNEGCAAAGRAQGGGVREPLEMEVIEVDGKPLPERSAVEPDPGGRSSPWAGGWSGRAAGWGGKVVSLDRRWWPLIGIGGVLLGVVVFVVILAVMAGWLVLRLAGLLLSPLAMLLDPTSASPRRR